MNVIAVRTNSAGSAPVAGPHAKSRNSGASALYPAQDACSVLMPSFKMKILLCDSCGEQSGGVRNKLRGGGIEEVAFHRSIGELPEAVVRHSPDVVCVCADLPGRHLFAQIAHLQEQQPRPVILMTRECDSQSIQAAVQAGVCACISDDLTAPQLKLAIESAIATFRQTQLLRSELAQAKSDLEQRKLVDRAKAILMKERNLSEEQAYHLLRRVAMNRKKKLSDVAQDVIALDDLNIP